MKLINVEGNKTVKDFLIGQYPVTQKQFEKIMGFNPSYFKGKKLPVEQVTWYDSIMFCNMKSISENLECCYFFIDVEKNKYNKEGNMINANVQLVENANGYRLLTSEEWEYAAKGGNKSQGYKYSGSNNFDEVGWNYNNSNNKTHKVGEKKPNELGIYDVSGNVWEWCWDLYNNNRSSRVLRGGSWDNYGYYCAVSYVYYSDPDYRYYSRGFRVCRLPWLGLIE